MQNHRRHVEEALDGPKEAGLVARMSKMVFFAKDVQFCGHILEGGTRRPAPGNLVAISTYTAPQTVRELRGFLGLCNYYSQYVSDYRKKAEPLVDLLKGIPKNEMSSKRQPEIW